ncbi:hypothetical protein ADUPG1_005104, partial [Aduncisulcus paluster]
LNSDHTICDCFPTVCNVCSNMTSITPSIYTDKTIDISTSRCSKNRNDNDNEKKEKKKEKRLLTDTDITTDTDTTADTDTAHSFEERQLSMVSLDGWKEEKRRLSRKLIDCPGPIDLIKQELSSILRQRKEAEEAERERKEEEEKKEHQGKSGKSGKGGKGGKGGGKKGTTSS